METHVSPDFPSLNELLELVTFTLDTIKDAVKRLSKGGISADHAVLASLPTHLPMVPILLHLEAIQQETTDYYYQADNSLDNERVPDALGLRDRQAIVQAIDLFVIFEVHPRLAPGVGIPLSKRVNSEAVAQVFQALREQPLLSSASATVWPPSGELDLEQIALRLTGIIARRQRGDVASILAEKAVADLIPSLLQLSYAPLPPTHDCAKDPVFWIHRNYMVVADPDRRIELRKRFTRLFDSSNAFVLLETLTSLLNASLDTRGAKWFRTLCSRFLSRVMMRPNGVHVTVDFIAGNDDDGLDAAKLERIANLLLTPPAGMDRSEYYAKVVPQIVAMAIPAATSSSSSLNSSSVDPEDDHGDAKQMVDYIMDKAASQERTAQAAVFALQTMAANDTKAFVEYAANPILLPIKRWFDERIDERKANPTVDPISRALESLKPKIQIIEDLDLDASRATTTVSSAIELQRALGGIQQLVLVYGSPSSEPHVLLEGLVVPVFVPLVHWYAYESSRGGEQIKPSEVDNSSSSSSKPRSSAAEILREIVTTTLAGMPHRASVAMVVELIQHVRNSANEELEEYADWPVFVQSSTTATTTASLVWRSSQPPSSLSSAEHVPVDALLEILSDARLSGLVGDLFVTLLREQEALMELVRSNSSNASSSNVNSIRGLTHKWWLVSQATMSIIDRFGPAVLSRHSDILAFILNVLDRYMDDATVADNGDDVEIEQNPLESLETLMQTLDVGESDTESKVGGTEIVMLALMLLGQLMSAGEEKAFAGETTGLFDTSSLKLLRTIHGQIKQIGRDKRIVRAVAQMATAVQMQVTIVLALQGEDVSEARDPLSETAKETAGTDVSRFNAALRDVQDDLVPVQAHGIIELRNMVLAKSRAVLESSERLDATIGVFVDKVKSADSFVYLNAVRGLSALADAHGRRFIPRLVEMYQNTDFQLDEQLRVGEALMQSIQRAGEMLPEYAPLFVPQLLAIVQTANTEDEQQRAMKEEVVVVRAHSALSILAAAAQTSALALNRWMDLIAATVDGILLLVESSAVELRRAAVVFWVSLLRGFGSRLVELVDMDILRQMHRSLRRISDSDAEDELTQMHAQVGVEELDDAVKAHLFLP